MYSPIHFFINDFCALVFSQALLSSAAVASANLVSHGGVSINPPKTPEVKAAEAAHFAARVGQGYPYVLSVKDGLITYYNGVVVPVDAPDVQAAKMAHFAAYGLPAVPLA